MLKPNYTWNRRQWLQVGTAGVAGMMLPIANCRGQAAAPVTGSGPLPNSAVGNGKAKSVLIVLMSGGLSQLDSLDMKPHAPAEIRGEFGAIGTTIPGEPICEHLPLLAQRLKYWTIARTLAHRETNHLLATHVALTGRDTPVPRGGGDIDRVESRSDFPNYAAALDYIRPRHDGIPTGVSLPKRLVEGPLIWPGQHAGFLGAKHDPWQITSDPNDAAFRIDSLNFQEGVSTPRMVSRRQLLDDLNGGSLWGASSSQPAISSPMGEFGEQQDVAYSMLTSARIAQAFHIDQEAASMRDRYGRNTMGQSLLLSRRLIEAGVPMVQATMGQVQTWDTHTDNWGRLKNTLLPQLDQGLAALIEDLSTSGLLEQTLVFVTGEFGRTPAVSTLPGQTLPGRDHWAHTYSALFAGAGVRGGQIIGKTDSRAAHPETQSWSPADICTTLFSALGVSRDAVLIDPLGRPNHLLNGVVMEPLYTGHTT